MSVITFNDFARQGEEIVSLRRQLDEHRMVHALLITGENGAGKKTLAGLVAEALMCKADTNIPCGACSGCRLAQSGEHPDITIVTKGTPLTRDTSKGKNNIPVDDIREIIRICSLYSLEGGNRAVIIQNAEDMTFQAQNSLLKILEEPPQNTYFILTSSHPDQLLPTVISRCRPVKLIPWDKEYIQKVLECEGADPVKSKKAAEASYGSIGYAKKLITDDQYWKTQEDILDAFFRNRKRSRILNISQNWKDRKSEADTLFDILEQHVRILLNCRLHPGSEQTIRDYPAEWQRFSQSASLERFTFLYDKICEARKQMSFNVNFQAVVEQLLLTFIGESEIWVQ